MGQRDRFLVPIMVQVWEWLNTKKSYWHVAGSFINVKKIQAMPMSNIINICTINYKTSNNK